MEFFLQNQLSFDRKEKEYSKTVMFGAEEI